MKDRLTYTAPLVEFVTPLVGTLICTSPEDGGHEGIGFEDWQ